jgi:AbrB family looped-hinge helix DNA binding protein
MTSKGRVTVPKASRDFLRISADDQIEFVVMERGEVVIRKLYDVRVLRELLKRRRQRSASIEEMNGAIVRQPGPDRAGL